MFLNGLYISPFVAPGARMVRELFVMAREHAPSIIFMDEIDSIGSSRLEGGSGGDSEVQRTMLELLNQLDGFEATKNIKVSYNPWNEPICVVWSHSKVLGMCLNFILNLYKCCTLTPCGSHIRSIWT